MNANTNENSVISHNVEIEEEDENSSSWDVCSEDSCTNSVHPRRRALGYTTYLEHGGKPKAFTVAPAYNKGGYQLITPQNVSDIGKKG